VDPVSGVDYHFGIDGISSLLLTTFIGVIALLFLHGDRGAEKEYYVLLLLLQCFMIGTFCASISSVSTSSGNAVPMYLIGWGGEPCCEVLPTRRGPVLISGHHRSLLLQHDGLPRVPRPPPRADLRSRKLTAVARDAMELQIWLFAPFLAGMRCRCFRSTRGCPTDTEAPRRVPSFWPRSCKMETVRAFAADVPDAVRAGWSGPITPHRRIVTRMVTLVQKRHEELIVPSVPLGS
jgi:hypothetical protein